MRRTNLKQGDAEPEVKHCDSVAMPQRHCTKSASRYVKMFQDATHFELQSIALRCFKHCVLLNCGCPLDKSFRMSFRMSKVPASARAKAWSESQFQLFVAVTLSELQIHQKITGDAVMRVMSEYV